LTHSKISCFRKIEINQSDADGPRDALSVEILSLSSRSGAAIIGETGGHVPQHFGWGRKGKCPPLIAYLVKFLGHIFHLDKLDYCISRVSMHCFPHV